MNIRNQMNRITNVLIWLCIVNILIFLVFCGVNIEVLGARLESESETVSGVLPEELDLGDYRSEMQPGEKQLVTVTVIPLDASEKEITYTSSNPAVATINGMGRITALSEGETKITASCGEVTADFALTVKEAEEVLPVKVTELDFWDCPKEITVGASQLLHVAVIPANATETELIFQSDNSAVATVNALGRITGIAVGKAVITVSCGEVRGTFAIEVVGEQGIEDAKVSVQDIEIGDYEEELEVDKTLGLSVTVLPDDATDSKITYRSSDTSIATVNSSGEVKGISMGQVIIYVSAGGVTREVPITVKIGTTVIELNSDYRVMKPGETFQIEASVQPAGAASQITYKSLDTGVAEVNTEGMVIAKDSGNTAIVVSNGDIQTSVAVIVNEKENKKGEKESATGSQTQWKDDFPTEISTKEYPVISSWMLKYLYENKQHLTIQGDGYVIYLDGKDIVNYENELNTVLDVKEEKDGFSFTINDGKKLCGKIILDFSERVQQERYLYLYNQTKETYELLRIENIKQFTVDTQGTYLLTARKMSDKSGSLVLSGIGVIVVLVGIGVYIGMKKQYLFW